MKSDPLKKRIRVSHFGNMNYLGNTAGLFDEACRDKKTGKKISSLNLGSRSVGRVHQ